VPRPVTIAILAGGKSSRFGGIDKQEISLDGEKLGRIAARSALSTGAEVIVVGRNRRPYDALPLAFAEDIVPGFGPLSGLHAALTMSRTAWVYLVACDMPFFNIDWLEYLLSCVDHYEALALAARFDRYIEPFHALYSRSLIEPLDKVFKEGRESPRHFSCVRLMESVPHHFVPENVARAYTPDWKLFYSVNTPKDLEKLQSTSHAQLK